MATKIRHIIVPKHRTKIELNIPNHIMEYFDNLFMTLALLNVTVNGTFDEDDVSLSFPIRLSPDFDFDLYFDFCNYIRDENKYELCDIQLYGYGDLLYHSYKKNNFDRLEDIVDIIFKIER